MMKAIICNEFGGVDKLSFIDIDTPKIKEDELLIKTAYCGVNFPDLLIVQGKYQYRPDFPFSPGQEVSGAVLQVGSKVEGFKEGDSVLASMTFGGYTEQAIAKAINVYHLPAEVPLDQAATILESFGTAMHALKDRAMMKPGSTLLVLGASGGTGSAAVQLGKRFGCRVIGVSSTDAKRAFVTSIGADYSLPYEDLKTAVKALGGADVIFDPVGGTISEEAFRTINPYGKHLIVGFADGNIPALPFNLPLLKSADIVGVSWGGFWRSNPQENRKNIKLILNWFAQEKLKSSVSEYALKDALKAMRQLQERKSLGKIVLKV
jgi:NADPH2:quinone reductase